jgi:cytochrome c oxidase cbb3-type subunit III
MLKIIPVVWGSQRCAQVFARSLSMSVFWAISFCSWSGEEAVVVYAQKNNHVAGSGPSHQASSDAGGKLFESSCAGCHGLDGRGGEKGPNIATRPEISRRSNEALLAILQSGVPGAGMPAFSKLGDAKLQALVRHLRSLQGLNAKTMVTGNAEEGRKLFSKEGGCATCHMINGAGGFLGSDLSGYGAVTSVAEMREQLMNHGQSPRSRTIVVSTRDGRRLSGFARNEDNFSLQLQTLDGKFHFLDKSTLVNIDYSPSASGVDVQMKLSESDLDALVSFLVITARRSQHAKLKMLPRQYEAEED